MNPVEAFYENSIVLISGGTGFLGSVLAEKLLRCFNVEKIFLMVRSKNGLDVEHRLQNLLNLPIFDNLRKNCPEALKKIIPVEINYDSHDLNISPNLLSSIRSQVQVNK